jgi:hypothetical protein
LGRAARTNAVDHDPDCPCEECTEARDQDADVMWDLYEARGSLI